MRKFILDYAGQFKIGFEAAKHVKIKGKFDNIIVCGIGGSAQPSDLLGTILYSRHGIIKNVKIPIITNRSYYLPKSTTKKSLIFISSYSGNTEEPIYCFHQAKKIGLKMVGFAKGGRVEELCKKNKIPFVKYPDDGPDFQPRLALGYSVSAMLTVAQNIVNINAQKIIINIANGLKKFDYEAQAKELVKKLTEKIPVIYTGDQIKIVARIWKIKFNENSKVPAFWNYFPELNHNEMVGFTNPQGKYHIIILKDPSDHPRNLKRIEITLKLLRQKGCENTILELPKKDITVKIFANLWLADWVTYYLALEYKIDPIAVKMVEDLKKMLVQYPPRW